jgi:hypothetical protein
MKDLLICINQNIGLNSDIEGQTIQELEKNIDYLIHETRRLCEDDTQIDFYGVKVIKDKVTGKEIQDLIDGKIKKIVIAGTEHYKCKCVYIIKY